MEPNMEEYADILEHELESAVEVKDKNSLHRAVRLIAENTVGRREYDSGIGQLKSDVKLIAERMEHGFQRMDERFEAVDKRFEAIQTQMDQRFDAMQTQMGQRFDAMQTQMGQRFDAMQTQMGQRFEASDKRFESLQIQMDRRFNDMNSRFDDMNGKFRLQTAFLGLGFTIVTTAVMLVNFLG
jgi:DNA anti-recombination protein RmuC